MRTSTRLERAAAVAEMETRLAAGQTQRQAAGAGVRLVSEFLQLSGLSAVVAASYGNQQALTAALEAAAATWGAAAVDHEQAQARQAEARGLWRELGQLYHPYDLASGQAQPVAAVAARFAAVWARLQRLAAVAELPAQAHAHLA